MILYDRYIGSSLIHGLYATLTKAAAMRPTGGKMNIYNRQKAYEKPLKKIINLLLLLVLFTTATFIGIQFGNLWYHLDIKIIDNIDTENFKNTISFSMPIIETVYNSGKSSVSFSSEIKEIFTGVFGFDLHTPSTIFSAHSPLFRHYYEMQNASGRNADNQPLSDDTDHKVTHGRGNGPGLGDTPYEGGTGKGTVPNEGDTAPGKNGEILNKSDAGQGTNDGSRTGSGENAGTDGKGDSTGKGDSADKGDAAGKGQNGPDGQNGPGGRNSTGDSPDKQITESSINLDPYTDSLPQWASSISWETEDEEKDDKVDIVEIEKIAIKNHTRYKIDVAKLLKQPLNLDLSKKGPKVLIYHTHTSESYVLKESDLGKKNVPSFNSNPKYNVVRVGEELARYLKKYGIETLHNGTIHDKVRDAAYSVSVNTLKSYRQSYPSIQVYIDVHRDAVNSDKPKLRATTEINGKSCAQIMFVVGAEGTLPHPKWQENLSFVLKLQQKLNEKYPGLARPIWIVEARYNQHISTQSILIEVGGDGNLLSECLESTKYLAEVLHEVMTE